MGGVGSQFVRVQDKDLVLLMTDSRTPFEFLNDINDVVMDGGLIVSGENDKIKFAIVRSNKFNFENASRLGYNESDAQAIFHSRDAAEHIMRKVLRA